jgi:hypothetical protein
MLNDWTNFGTSSRVKTRNTRDSDSNKEIHVPRGKDFQRPKPILFDQTMKTYQNAHED